MPHPERRLEALLPGILAVVALPHHPGPNVNTNNDSLVLSVEGTAEALPAGATVWTSAQAGKVLRVGDRLRTGARSRAAIRLSDLSVLRVSELMTYEFPPPYKAGGKPVIDIEAGTAYFFSRDKPQEIQLRTPVATGAVRGTEFCVTVLADGQTELALLDGQVELSTPQGSVVLTNGEQAAAQAGQAPVKTAVLHADNVIQWNLYYPAVLDPGRIGFGRTNNELWKNPFPLIATAIFPRRFRNTRRAVPPRRMRKKFSWPNYCFPRVWLTNPRLNSTSSTILPAVPPV